MKEQLEDLAALAIWPKMPVPDTLKIIQKAHPEVRLAVVCRAVRNAALSRWQNTLSSNGKT